MAAPVTSHAPRPLGVAAAALGSVDRLAEARAMGVLALQLVLVALVMKGLRIENPVFHDTIVPLAFGGALVHHWLPAGWRPWFFITLSIVGYGLVFGATGTLWFLGLSGVVIGWLHAPLPFRVRLVGWLLLAAVLGWARAGKVDVPWTGAIWPVFGSIFFMRAILYLYDLRHQKGPTNWRMAFSYFFMVPGVAFPFFPMVDYGIFRRTYYDKPALGIYQTGLHWIVRGVTHLVVYRAIYQYFTLAPSEVDSGAELVQYLLANFGLYLRVSGQYHVITGMLHLFGFRLPETHRFFYVAASLPDLWRRINIYWKDFMQKVFYMPVFFPLMKKRGEVFAIVVATSLTIVATWFLHSWQWFWLLGRWLFTSTDVLFWAILGVMLIVAALHERKKGRVRPGSPEARTWQHQVRIGFSAIFWFAFMASLWGFWTAPSVAEGLNLFAVDSWDMRATLMVLVLGVVIGVSAGWTERIRPPGHEGLVPPTALRTVVSAVPLLALWGAGSPRMGEQLPTLAREVARDLRVAELNARDAAQLQRGYYEELVGVNRFNGELWNLYVQKSADWPRLQDLGGLRKTNDMLRVELNPFLGLMFHGHPFRTNEWGMRDQSYDKVPATDTWRVAVLGPSYVMGDGVPDGHTFEALIEGRLNRERPIAGPARWEFLNFGVSEYSPISNLIILENGRVTGFKPNAILIVGHGADLMTTDHVLWGINNDAITHDYLRRAVDSVGITRDLPRSEQLKRLRPLERQIVTETFRRLKAVGEAAGARVFWVYVPTPMQKPTEAREAMVIEVAKDAGLDVIDLRGLFAGKDELSLVVADWDRHPNAEGHRLIAERLYQELLTRAQYLGGPQNAAVSPTRP
ncbi:MAG: hypothetical protein IPK85_11805 [Gemmatimonadetes bacterium]|nr:hypothetical protein [Gemmatimonadota bacterium]